METKTKKETTEEVIPGAYTPFHCVSEQEKNLFEKVIKNLQGVKYDPVLVSSQLVAGTNYKFFCNAKIVYPDAPWYTAMVMIFEPLPGKGEPYVTEIKKITY
ncbi:MAG: hypothetical protein JEY96_05520 [Bacteroidales bacterium]|nr:hypothetical protein [Bacteroidales bacterium]